MQCSAHCVVFELGSQRLYQSAIEGHPDHASIICKYAGFVKTVKGDMALAEQLYRRAIAVNPEHAERYSLMLRRRS
jgi:hypothetical protein